MDRMTLLNSEWKALDGHIEVEGHPGRTVYKYFRGNTCVAAMHTKDNRVVTRGVTTGHGIDYLIGALTQDVTFFKANTKSVRCAIDLQSSPHPALGLIRLTDENKRRIETVERMTQKERTVLWLQTMQDITEGQAQTQTSMRGVF